MAEKQTGEEGCRVSDYPVVENARITSVRLGSRYHDGRGFFSVNLEGQSWGQGCNPRFTPEFIDALIECAGREHLSACEGALVRVCWNVEYGPIAAIGHPIKDRQILVLTMPEVAK